MKVGLLALLTCMNGFVLAVSSYERQLQYEGAPATITMTVRDEHGVPVEGALGEAFYSQWSGKPEKISVRSNEHGNLTFQGGGVYEAIFYITKEGYYETKGRVQFRCRQRIQNTFGNVRRGNLHIWMLYSRQSAIRFLVGFMQEK